MSNTIAISDYKASTSMTMTATLGQDDVMVKALLAAMVALDSLPGVEVATIVYDSLATTVTLKDARTFVFTLHVASPPTFQLVSTDFWTLDEVAAIREVGKCVNTLVLAASMSALTCTYA